MQWITLGERELMKSKISCMNKPNFNIVFIVLVYRNVDDLIDFFKYNKVKNSKVIVVNSFYDESSDHEFRKIASINCADIITVPNKGYGAGNNRGIEYAIAHYNFNFLVISNADITIRTFSETILQKFHNCIIAPKIITRTGKNQNPSSPFKPNKIIEKLQYKAYKGNHRKLIIAFYAWSRFQKIIFYIIKRFKHRIFSPHGAFFIMPKNILLDLIPIYNEEMFLFFEENHLGKHAKLNGIKIVYAPEIVIDHKEDGSVSLLKTDNFNLMKDSYMKMYEYWNNIEP